MTRRARLFVRLAALFVFVLYALVRPLRDWVPLWFPVLCLLGLEALFFWSGYRDEARRTGPPMKRFPGLEDADLLESGYRRALLRREVDRGRLDPADLPGDIEEEEDWELPEDDAAPPEAPFSGWQLGPLRLPAWAVEAAGLTFVALWLALPGVRDAVPALITLLVGALALAGAVSGLLVSGVAPGVRSFTYRHPRVVQLAELTAVLLVAAGIFLALFRPQGWDAVPEKKQARAERAFSRAAGAIAGKTVSVRCDDDYRATGFTHDALGVAVVGGTQALLEPDVCHDLARLALDRRVVSRDRTSRAIVVLAHEAWHLRGEASERVAECRALQSGIALGVRFGLGEARAHDFMRYRLALNASDYRGSPAYVVGSACRLPSE